MNKLPGFKSSIDISIILSSMYDISYGIYDRNKNTSPLAKVSSHPSEKILPDGRFETSLRKFMEADVYAQTGINFKEAIEFETFRFEELCRISADVANKKADAAKKAMSDASKGSNLPSP